MLVERVSDLEQKNKDTEMNFDLLNEEFVKKDKIISLLSNEL